MAGKMVEFPVGGRSASGWLATPPSGSGPALIVIQEWWGLVPHIKDVTERFAAEGFVALAPDFYNGDTTTSSDEAGHKLMGLDLDSAAADIGAAVDFLLAQPGNTTKKAGVVGFCMGGQLALLGGCEHPDKFSAIVDFYGVHPKIVLRVERLAAPVLAHFVHKDIYVAPEDAAALVKRIRDAGKDLTLHHYEAEHAFFNDTRPEVYDADASKLAWARTLEFLREHST